MPLTGVGIRSASTQLSSRGGNLGSGFVVPQRVIRPGSFSVFSGGVETTVIPPWAIPLRVLIIIEDEKTAKQTAQRPQPPGPIHLNGWARVSLVFIFCLFVLACSPSRQRRLFPTTQIPPCTQLLRLHPPLLYLLTTLSKSPFGHLAAPSPSVGASLPKSIVERKSSTAWLHRPSARRSRTFHPLLHLPVTLRTSAHGTFRWTFHSGHT